MPFTPTWPSHGVHHVHTPVIQITSQEGIVEQGPNFDFYHYSYPGTPVISRGSAPVQGILISSPPPPPPPQCEAEAETEHCVRDVSPEAPPKVEERDLDPDIEWMNQYIVT